MSLVGWLTLSGSVAPDRRSARPLRAPPRLEHRIEVLVLLDASEEGDGEAHRWITGSGQSENQVWIGEDPDKGERKPAPNRLQKLPIPFLGRALDPLGPSLWVARI